MPGGWRERRRDARRAPRFDPMTKQAVRTTLLMAACAAAKAPLVEFVLSRGAEPALDDGRGREAFHHAITAYDQCDAADCRACISALLAAGSRRAERASTGPP